MPPTKPKTSSAIASTTASVMPQLSAQAAAIVSEVGRPVRPGDVEKYIRLRDASERFEHVRTIINAWTRQQEEERNLRRTYAKWLIIAFCVEIVLIFLAFFLYGVSVISADRVVVGAFLGTALAQTAALLMVIVRYLFPDRGSDLLRLVETGLSTPRTLKAGR